MAQSRGTRHGARYSRLGAERWARFDSYACRGLGSHRLSPLAGEGATTWAMIEYADLIS